MTIMGVMDELATINKSKRLNENSIYIVWNNMVFKDGFDLENHLYQVINDNNGLGVDWLKQEYESSYEQYGKDIIANVNDYVLMW